MTMLGDTHDDIKQDIECLNMVQVVALEAKLERVRRTRNSRWVIYQRISFDFLYFRYNLFFSLHLS